jgi:hypothetical protein
MATTVCLVRQACGIHLSKQKEGCALRVPLQSIKQHVSLHTADHFVVKPRAGCGMQLWLPHRQQHAVVGVGHLSGA